MTDNGLLFKAVENEDIETIKSLLSSRKLWIFNRPAKANVNAKNNEGASPLHFAVGKNNETIVKLLIDNGADVNAATNKGDRPLHYVQDYGNESIVELLIASGADVNAGNNKGFTPLHLAALFLNENFAKQLIGHGANVNATKSDGETPLHGNVMLGDEKVAEILIAGGADVNATDNDGETPLHKAAMENNETIAKILIEHGADVNRRDKDDETPLYYARLFENGKIARLLITHGADDEEVDQEMQGKGYASTARVFFTEPSCRSLPRTPSDFDLFDIPQFSLESWAKTISEDPSGVYCHVTNISNLGNITRTLYDILKEKFDLTSSDAVDIFNTYIGAACPECFSGLTGELLQTIESSKNAAGAVFTGGSDIQRVLDGNCVYCDSDIYYIIWYGEK